MQQSGPHTSAAESLELPADNGGYHSGTTGLSSHFAIAAELVAALTSLATTAAFC